MLFTNLTDVPEVIKDFYFEDEDGQLQTQQAGEHKSINDIERVIALGRPNANAVLAKFAPMVNRASQWAWFQEYLEYLKNLENWQLSSDSFVPIEPEDVFNVEEPSAPTRPQDQTTEQILAPYWGSLRSKILKEAKVTTTLGNQYDADEVSINRLTMAIVALASQDNAYSMPWSLANTGTGVMTLVTLGDLKEAQALAATNMSTIWSI